MTFQRSSGIRIYTNRCIVQNNAAVRTSNLIWHKKYW